jgi:hypothetical protein
MIKKVTVWLMGAIFLLGIFIAYLFLSWEQDMNRHPDSESIKQYLHADRVVEIGLVSSPYLYTPTNYGFLVKEGNKSYVAVFEKYFHQGKRAEYDKTFLKVLSGEKIVSSDNEAIKMLTEKLKKDGSEVSVLSKHRIVKVDKEAEKTLDLWFYKVVVKNNKDTFLFFYADEKNMLSMYTEGYKKLLEY